MNDRIKQLRKHLNLTQQQFAEQIGSVQNTITGYETGRRVPSNQVITLICKTFDVNEEWLRTGKGEMFIQLDRDDQIARWAGNILHDEGDTFKKRFVAALSKLSENDWVALERFLLDIKKDPED